MLTRKLMTAFSMATTVGVSATCRHAAAKFTERFIEWRLGIRSTGEVSAEKLGLSEGCNAYGPVSFKSFQATMSRIAITPSDVLLDIGSGMGRLVVLASNLPFKRIIGVEFSKEMHEIAKKNVAARKRKVPVEIINADATAYPIPADVTVIYFTNSFSGAPLETLMANIKQSLAESPRRLTFIVNAPSPYGVCMQLKQHFKMKEAFAFEDRHCAIFTCSPESRER